MTLEARGGHGYRRPYGRGVSRAAWHCSHASYDVIHDPRRLRLLHGDGRPEEITVDKPLPQQAYVLQAMDRLIADPLGARAHNEASRQALELMDAVRAQVGVRFPSDRARS